MLFLKTAWESIIILKFVKEKKERERKKKEKERKARHCDSPQLVLRNKYELWALTETMLDWLWNLTEDFLE